MTLLHKLLKRAVDRDASDIHIKAGSCPYFRIDGELNPRTTVLSDEDVDGIVESLLSDMQKHTFQDRGEVDLAYVDEELGRFRVNIFRQRGRVSMVLRRIKSDIPSFEELHLPMAVEQFCRAQRGIILITGTTGSGKSTTLAAMIDYINQNEKCHVVTIEDPIEYVHEDSKAVINQREVRFDTESFSTALRAVMRQDPDVILVGEMRDLETFQAAISASETGHLVFSTLHTANVMQTIDRIIDLFPSDQQQQVRSQLSMNLKGIMCQRLLPRASGTGRVPACEVMFVTPAIQRLIRDNRLNRLPVAIQQGREEGMMSFNDSLYGLLKAKLIDLDTASTVSDNAAELNLMLQGIELGKMRGGLLGE
ncbi:MAG: type IV pilus twitching motility protein PilT [Candidatus Hydrogenedentes bacterium]|nr:type IV pilus twitching motility protein PilT [Candidatus Hydrogenedentota bacterium]